MTLDKINEFAEAQGFERAVYLKEWQGYACYEVVREDEASCMGLSPIILVKGEEIRMSTVEEAMRI